MASRTRLTIRDDAGTGGTGGAVEGGTGSEPGSGGASGSGGQVVVGTGGSGGGVAGTAGARAAGAAAGFAAGGGTGRATGGRGVSAGTAGLPAAVPKSNTVPHRGHRSRVAPLIASRAKTAWQAGFGHGNVLAMMVGSVRAMARGCGQG